MHSKCKKSVYKSKVAGQWSVHWPRCQEVTCNRTVANGEWVECTGNDTEASYGESCQLMCHPGYKAFPESDGTCESDEHGNGVWSSHCEEVTCNITSANDGWVECTDWDNEVPYGEFCHLKCHRGYKPVPNEDVTCESDDHGNGEWSAYCEVIKCLTTDLPVPENGLMDCYDDELVHYNDSCTLSCYEGYKPSADRLVQCIIGKDGNGAWSNASLECTAITCPPPMPVTHGGWGACEDISASVGQSCYLSCDTGYQPSLTTIHCQYDGSAATGTWNLNNQNAQCQEIKCDTESLDIKFTSAAGITSGVMVSYGTTYIMICGSTMHLLMSCSAPTTSGMYGTWNRTTLNDCSDPDTEGPTTYQYYKHVGLEHPNLVPDSSFTTSSNNGMTARLNATNQWCSNPNENTGLWVKVNLGTADAIQVYGIITQGSSENYNRVTEYSVAYAQSVPGDYLNILNSENELQVFFGNTENSVTPVVRLFSNPIFATVVKVKIVSWYNENGISPACLRFELLTDI